MFHASDEVAIELEDETWSQDSRRTRRIILVVVSIVAFAGCVVASAIYIVFKMFQRAYVKQIMDRLDQP
jgi:hypothetical protein